MSHRGRIPDRVLSLARRHEGTNFLKMQRFSPIPLLVLGIASLCVSHPITADSQAVLFGGIANSQESAIDEALSASYAPITVDCPSNTQWVRPANRLGKAEAEWVSKRKPVVLEALDGYLERLGLQDFSVCEFGTRIREAGYEHVHTIGMAISGGGYRSGYTETGAMRAPDSRTPDANKEKTVDCSRA